MYVKLGFDAWLDREINLCYVNLCSMIECLGKLVIEL